MIDKLNFFIALARERHFGKAALKLGITQPSLSAAIRQLEETLGVMLINRGSRFQNLTDEGKKVLDWALKITADTRTMREELKTSKKGLSGTLLIGAVPTALPTIPELTNAFLHKHPGVNLKLFARNSDEVIGALERFEIDVGMTYLNNDSLGKLKTLPFYAESYCLTTHKKNKPHNCTRISWSEAAQFRLCLLTDDMQNRRILNNRFFQDGIKVNPMLEANSLMALLAHIRTGKWSSILPLSLANLISDNREFITIPMEEPQIRHKIGLVALPRNPTTPIIAAFLKEVESIAQKRKKSSLQINNTSG